MVSDLYLQEVKTSISTKKKFEYDLMNKAILLPGIIFLDNCNKATESSHHEKDDNTRYNNDRHSPFLL
jgi:hypothetical protein